jgi:DNA (cytosine-5)-methyltransferase 1
VRRPRLLDLFCGEGGAARGYIDTGFDVTGVDLKASAGRRYPGTFVHGDALDYAWNYGHRFDAIHASPPCQAYSIATAGNPDARAKHQRLIAATRDVLGSLGRPVPYVIENVAQARSELVDPIQLCGTMFGLSAVDDDGTPLEMWRHRLFESNVALRPGWCRHGWYSEQVAGSYGGARRDKHEARHVRHGGYVPAKHVQAQLLGIDWMTAKGMHESIPPAFAHHVGDQLRAHIESQERAA